MLGTFKRAGDVLDLFTAQVLTIAGRLRILQIAVHRCAALGKRVTFRTACGLSAAVHEEIVLGGGEMRRGLGIAAVLCDRVGGHRVWQQRVQ